MRKNRKWCMILAVFMLLFTVISATPVFAGQGNADTKQLSPQMLSGNVPETVSLVKLSSKPGQPAFSVSSSSAGKLKVTIKKKAKNADGYQVVVARDKKFTKSKKTKNFTGTSKTVSGLTAGAKYFVRVRAYTSSSGGRQYGKYSSTVSVTVKKSSARKSSSGGSETVYITRTGEKYHRGSCSSLRRSKIKISRKDAVAKGYTPCSLCKP